MSARDTIFALSSGRPPAAIGVIRISGPRAGEALKILTGKIPAPRTAAFARIRDGQGAIIDEALALWFPAPKSETGEDVAEIQLHGGRAVIAATLATLSAIDGLRHAEAGEFTRRAFENGKLDLTAVEGLADLVAAETEGQRRQALRQMQGALRQRAEKWREMLTSALALVNAGIDFSDEGDVPENVASPALQIVRELAGEINAALDDQGRGERLRDGLVVAIAGPPNAGKSTLLNRIAQREAAIVSPIAGTTRDVIEVHLDLGGYPVTLLDTAGIRPTEDPVELEGVRRAQARAAAADLVLWVVDAGEANGIDPASATLSDRSPASVRPKAATPVSPPGRATTVPARSADPSLGSAALNVRPGSANQSAGLPGAQAAQGRALSTPRSVPAWKIRNKIDLSQKNEPKNSSIDKNEPEVPNKSFMVNNELTPSTELEFNRNELEFYLSATTGAGFEGFLKALLGFAADSLSAAEPALVTRQRHREALGTALAALHRAVGEAAREDLFAEELRVAAHALARLTGRVDVEDVLDVIFRDFCIGK